MPGSFYMRLGWKKPGYSAGRFIDSLSPSAVRLWPQGIMGRNKKLRIRLEGLRGRITDHRIKIALEQQGAHPDRRLIKHWEVEIRAWERTVSNLERRLKKGKRHD